MPRTTTIALVAATILVVTGSASGSPTSPSLRLVDVDPVTIAATAFKAGERVRVTLTVPARQPITWRLRARPNGTFRVQSVTVSLDPCEYAFARAVGVRGSTAVAKKLPDRMCLVERAG